MMPPPGGELPMPVMGTVVKEVDVPGRARLSLLGKETGQRKRALRKGQQ